MLIPESPTVETLTEEIWRIVSRRNVDRQIAIEAVRDVLQTLKVDQRTDEQLGLSPKGQPSRHPRRFKIHGSSSRSTSMPIRHGLTRASSMCRATSACGISANDSMLAATFSPRTFAKQQAAITRTGAIQIRCTRHDANIATFTMRAVKKERQKKGRSDDAKTNK